METNNVNNTEVTCMSLCYGYGGMEMGVKRIIPNLRTVLYSEIEVFAVENLAEKMEKGVVESAPIWTNLKTLPCEYFSGRVDVLIASYPCQPFSNAGKRAGVDDERHLWPYIRRIIRIVGPKLCFFENVEGHINRGLERVLSDLEAEGYRATWGIFSAAETGAPHGRKRVFIMGDRGFDWEHYMADTDRARQYQSARRQREERDRTVDSGQAVANSCSAGLEGYPGHEQEAGPSGTRQDRPFATGSLSLRWPARPGQKQYEWEEPRLVTKFNRKGE